MKWIPHLLVGLTLSSSVAMAQAVQEYQQALPDGAAAQKIQPVIQVVKSSDNKKKHAIAQAADSQIAVLMSRLMQLNKEVAVYQQNTMQRIDNIKNNEGQARDNVRQLQQVIQSLSQQVQSLKTHQEQLTALSETAAQQSNSWLSRLEKQTGPAGVYGGLAVLAILMLSLGWMWAKKSASPKKATEAGADQSEYDFMATSEAIPAKLDLARAYVAMDDRDSAKNVLAEVFAKGSDAQKKEAQALLASLEKNDHAN